MKIIGVFVFLIILVFSSGCTTYFSNLQTPQKTLNLTDSAIFSQDKTNFAASVSSVELNQKFTFPRQITVTMVIKNTGKDAFSLIGYPRLVDAEGREYAGTNIMFGGMNSGGQTTGKSTIRISTGEEYAALEKSALLKVKFQSMKPLPYEGIWNIDFSKL